MQLVKADLRFKDSVPAGLMDGVQAVVCCTGTTAFPTNRCEKVWECEECCIWRHGQSVSVVRCVVLLLAPPSWLHNQVSGNVKLANRPILLHRLHHRWDNDNGPKPTDLVAVGNLISLTPKSIDRFVYVTSAGKLELVCEGHKLCLMTYALLHT